MEQIPTIFCNIVGFDWAVIVQSIIGLWAVLIARNALHTWKSQSKAEKKIIFLDELTESVHEFILLISEPVEMVSYIKINIESYEETNTEETPYAGTINYIEKYGSADAQKINYSLDKCTKSISKIRSLIAKGQVLGLKDYEQCYLSCMNISNQHGRIHAFTTMLGDHSFNWKNKTVMEALVKVIGLNPTEISEIIENNNVLYLKFVKTNYEYIYK